MADWENVPLFGTAIPNSFQVRLGINGVEDIWFVYGDTGAPALLTVGAEDKSGAFGADCFVNGAGTRPEPATNCGSRLLKFRSPSRDR